MQEGGLENPADSVQAQVSPPQPNSWRKAARVLLTLPEKDERRVFEGKCANNKNDYNNQNL